MKKAYIVLILLFICIGSLSSCTKTSTSYTDTKTSTSSTGTQMAASSTGTLAQIDWVCFVKWGGISYVSADGGLVPSKLIGQKIGEVNEIAPSTISTVSGENYEPKDGMAALLPLGTKFYEIKGYDKKQYITVLTSDKYLLFKTNDSKNIDFKLEW